MTVSKEAQATAGTGAPSHRNKHWHAIDWAKANRTVKRLQTRIVKATQAGRPGKRKALQWLLTHSYSARALAVKRVTDNHGKNTPGVDGIIWNTPEKKINAVRQTGRRRNYRPQPLRRIYIPKASNPKKLRPLSIPCMADRAEQALHLQALDPVAETTQDPNSYGFRRERSTADALAQCFNVLSKQTCASYILEGDIKSCFDKISIEWLCQHVPMDQQILRKWLKAGFIDKGKLYESTEGTPQGGIASPVLANLALDGMERMLHHKLSSSKMGRSNKINVVKYADDFIVTGATQEVLEQEVKPLIEGFLAERGLELSSEKTVITHIDEGFDFLGCNLRKRKGKLLITPAAKNIAALKTKIRKLVEINAHNTAGELIKSLNPLLRGWGNYYKPWVSKQVFADIDSFLFATVWRWARKRHPTRNSTWRRKTYFTTQGNRHWVFTGQVATKAGNLHSIHLFSLASIRIQRHIKIKLDANPYDPNWESYFERRLHARMKDTLTDRMDLQMLWSRQSGICPMCKQPLLPEEAWERHHVIWRVMGGDNTLSNLKLLHANCHHQLHSTRSRNQNRDFTVASPGHANGLGKT
ncbi:MAG: group II intron reverse transcriptase/maturase [Anaerolineae bacterium]|nr:group II intron reverse transcriptase/maturase [Anaerolineae bacterium]